MRHSILLSLILISVWGFTSCQSTQQKKDLTDNKQNSVDEEYFFSNEGESQGENKDTAKKRELKEDSSKSDTTGYAAYFGRELHGKPTASGEIFDMNKYTGAHRSFAMGSIVMVKNLENGKKQLVKINDRGPYVDGRIIDVSFATAKDLDFLEKGVAKVEIELIQAGTDSFAQKNENKGEHKGERNSGDDMFFFEEDDTSGNKNKKNNFDAYTLQDNKKKNSSDDIFDEEDFNEQDLDKNAKFTFEDGKKPKGYTVQIGAFKKRANAEKHRQMIAKKFKQTTFIASKGNWHYVWIGDFQNKTQARNFFNKLKGDGVDVMYRGKPKDI